MCAATVAVMSHRSLQAFHPSEPVGAHSMPCGAVTSHRAFPSASIGSVAFPSYESLHPHAASTAMHPPNASHQPVTPAFPSSRGQGGSPKSTSRSAYAPSPSDAEFEHLSLEELRGVLTQRDHMVAELRHEISTLEREPVEFMRRLLELEKVFKDLTPADVIKLRSPLLRNISQAVRDDHVASHNLAAIDDAPDTLADLKASPDHFAMGRGCMNIDRAQMALEEEVKFEASRGQLVHPIDKKTAYAGHIGQPHGAAGAVLVGPAGGAIGRQPLAHPTPAGEFWLKASGFLPDQTGGMREASPIVDRLGMAKLRRAAAMEAVYGYDAAGDMASGSLLVHHGPP